jgi:hypothetical protein
MKTKSGYFVLAGMDVLVEYTYKPAIPGRFTGPPESCYEDEQEEIEIYSIKYKYIKLFKNGDGILNDDAVANIEQQISAYENDK